MSDRRSALPRPSKSSQSAVNIRWLQSFVRVAHRGFVQKQKQQRCQLFRSCPRGLAAFAPAGLTLLLLSPKISCFPRARRHKRTAEERLGVTLRRSEQIAGSEEQADNGRSDNGRSSQVTGQPRVRIGGIPSPVHLMGPSYQLQLHDLH